MSDGIRQVLARFANDWDFVGEFNENPEEALRGIDLTSAERAALLTRDTRQLKALGLSDKDLGQFVDELHTPTCPPATCPNSELMGA